MAAPIPSKEPTSVTAGDSVTFTKAFSDYPASAGWSLTYYLATPDGSQNITIATTTDADGISFDVNVPSTISWQPGHYDWQAKVNGNGQQFTVEVGTMEVLPDLSLTKDNRTHAKICLDNIEAVLEKRATREILNSEINGVRLDRIPLGQLTEMRDLYRIEYRQEQNAIKIKQGRQTGARVLTRFGGCGADSAMWRTKPWQ